MEYKTSLEIRRMFLEYFKSKGHTVEQGASLIPKDDETLLWINSGVAALKKYFDGTIKPNNPRIVNIQKAIRTNDIENVGKTSRHHTFFEMMGNFSIGDYFKEEAIDFAYEFLFSDDWIGFDLKKAYVSVHPDDQRSYELWTEKHNFPKERILKTEDNFWQIGNGPCGPNTEIFIDRGEAYDPDNIGERLFFEDIENNRYVEIWNVVFSQYDGKEGQDIHTFKELPQKNIDTGMGFERLVSLVQDVETNFDIDLFKPLITKLSSLTNTSYQENPTAYRVIIDHIRTLVFALSDGALFSNEGRGYVLRRILRRAVRFGRQLNIEESFLYKLVPVVGESMGEIYPNILKHEAMNEKLIISEEQRFSKTLDDGEKLLMKAIQEADNGVIDGQTAFKLYDTYGFPIELSEEIAEDYDITIDKENFEKEMEKQRTRARQARHIDESMKSQNEALLNFHKKSLFNYELLEVDSKVIGLFKNNSSVEELSGEGYLISEETPFYAESGGQISDTGIIVSDQSQIQVLDVSKAPNGQHVLHVKVDGVVRLDDLINLKVDQDRRKLITRHHSSVHLLQQALIETLGEHVKQAGSNVTNEYFRFDFSHFDSISNQTLKDIETKVNTWVAKALPVETISTSLTKAQEMGAIALTDGAYTEEVRVVKMGDVSMELCGGTHVDNTAEIGLFKITNEESVGSGTRRISGECSFPAYITSTELETEIENIRLMHKIPVQKTLGEAINDMENEIDQLKREKAILEQEAVAYEIKEYKSQSKQNPEGLKIVWIEKNNQDMKLLKKLADSLVNHIDVIVLINKKETSLNLMSRMSQSAIDKGYNAGSLIKELAQITGGNGGGRPDFAQAGGKNLEKVTDAKQSFFQKTSISL